MNRTTYQTKDTLGAILILLGTACIALPALCVAICYMLAPLVLYGLVGWALYLLVTKYLL